MSIFWICKEKVSGQVEKMRDKKMRQAVYGNLKLMKKVLTPEQYRKYVVLLNVTNNNNRTLNF